MKTINTIAELRATVTRWKAAGERVALVPTMGNLHAGHLQLVEQARKHAGRVVVSVFVNPMQFTNVAGDDKDFERYPRSLEEDHNTLSAVEFRPDAVFAPAVQEVYPSGFEQESRIAVPEISDILEGEFRPGHFVGVATVVAKLFNMVQPDVALFGEKDFQQLAVIRRFVTDLCFPVQVVAVPTVREKNGLAMSSRNQYLTPTEREQAALLYQVLIQAKQHIITSEQPFSAIQHQAIAQLNEAGFRSEYFELRRAEDLQVIAEGDVEQVLLVAAWLGKARLIDNLVFNR